MNEKDDVKLISILAELKEIADRHEVALVASVASESESIGGIFLPAWTGIQEANDKQFILSCRDQNTNETTLEALTAISKKLDQSKTIIDLMHARLEQLTKGSNPTFKSEVESEKELTSTANTISAICQSKNLSISFTIGSLEGTISSISFSPDSNLSVSNENSLVGSLHNPTDLNQLCALECFFEAIAVHICRTDRLSDELNNSMGYLINDRIRKDANNN